MTNPLHPAHGRKHVRAVEHAVGAVDPGTGFISRLLTRDGGFDVDDHLLAATRNELRSERLADRIAHDGPVAVRATIFRHAGQRVELHLDDDSILELRLFWARRDAVVALESLRWDDRVGWVLVVRTARGERRVDYAWLATLTPRPTTDHQQMDEIRR